MDRNLFETESTRNQNLIIYSEKKKTHNYMSKGDGDLF